MITQEIDMREICSRTTVRGPSPHPDAQPMCWVARLYHLLARIDLEGRANFSLGAPHCGFVPRASWRDSEGYHTVRACQRTSDVDASAALLYWQVQSVHAGEGVL